MKRIKFQKFDEQGYFKGEVTSAPKYTVRGAMQHLRDNGFVPMFESELNHKLIYFWTNERGINAHIK